MVERRIELKPEIVKDFVQVASQCEFDIDIFYNSFIVDAKSILGVLGLDFSQRLTVRYNGENPQFSAFLGRLEKAY